jgi:hypothetical protein
MAVESRVYHSDPIIASTQQQHVTCSENGCFFKRKSIKSVAIRHLCSNPTSVQRPRAPESPLDSNVCVCVCTCMYVHAHIYVFVGNPTSVSRERVFKIRRCASCQNHSQGDICTCMYMYVRTCTRVGNPTAVSPDRAFKIRRCGSCHFRTIPWATSALQSTAHAPTFT